MLCDAFCTHMSPSGSLPAPILRYPASTVKIKLCFNFWSAIHVPLILQILFTIQILIVLEILRPILRPLCISCRFGRRWPSSFFLLHLLLWGWISFCLGSGFFELALLGSFAWASVGITVGFNKYIAMGLVSMIWGKQYKQWALKNLMPLQYI